MNERTDFEYDVALSFAGEDRPVVVELARMLDQEGLSVFYDAYEKKWGVAPEGLGASSSYMAVYALRDAIERAGSLDPDKVVTELEKTDVMGVYGRLRFDPKSHQVIPAKDPKEGAVGSILQWQNEKRVVVYPESIAAGEIQLPPWMKK